MKKICGSVRVLKQTLLTSLILLFSSANAEVSLSGDRNSILFESLPDQTKTVILADEYGLSMKSENGQFLSENGFQDGLYQYQVMSEQTLSESRHSQYKKSLNNGRSAQQKQSNVGLKVLESGSFSLKQGQIIDIKAVEQES